MVVCLSDSIGCESLGKFIRSYFKIYLKKCEKYFLKFNKPFHALQMNNIVTH